MPNILQENPVTETTRRATVGEISRLRSHGSLYDFFRFDRPRYTSTDYRKVNSLLILLRGDFDFQSNPSDITSPSDILYTSLSFRSQTDAQLSVYQVNIKSNQASQRLFGCNLRSITTSLRKAIKIINLRFPLENNEAPLVTISHQHHFVSIQFKYMTGIKLNEQLFDAGRRNSSLFPRRMPTMPNLNISTLNVDNAALVISPAAEAELAGTYNSNLEALQRIAAQQPRGNTDEDLLSLSRHNISSYITNGHTTFGNNHYSRLSLQRRTIISNAANKLLSRAITYQERYRATDDISSIEEQCARESNTKEIWSNGVLFRNENGQLCFGYKFGRRTMEELFRVGNNGPESNRTHIGRELRHTIREINFLFETIGCVLTTHKITRENQETYRVFIVTNIPAYGSAWRMGVSPVLPQVSNQNQIETPSFFKNPMQGLNTRMSSIFQLLLGIEPSLDVEAQQIPEALALMAE